MENRIGSLVRHWALAFALAAGSFSAQATLLGRDINGNPVAANDASAVFEYDTDLNITWLRDWNYAQTSGFDADGLMSWSAAVAWASGLTVGSFSGWRLPTTNTGPSSNCSDFDNGPGGGFPLLYYGYNCTGSEMGHVWYTELGNTEDLTNTDPFENLQSYDYWSGTELSPIYPYAWAFGPVNGEQRLDDKPWELSAVAVRPGDVAAASAPEPGSLAVLLAGLVALSAARRRRPH